jgi:repressor LexA
VTEDLHPRRLEILKYLAGYLAGRSSEEPPSVAEIARAVKLKSTQTVHHHLLKLEEDGHIERLATPSAKPDRKRRPARLTEKGWQAVGSSIPALGRAAAGPGIEAIVDASEAGGTSNLAADLLVSSKGRRRYTVTAHGTSMTGARIEEGDVLLVEENEDPSDGTVVLALLNGETATVKRLYRDGENVRLRYQNGESREIVMPAEDVRVQGEIIRVIHAPGR